MSYNPLSEFTDEAIQAETRRRGFDGGQAIREYVVGKITLHVDNTEALYGEVRAAAIEAVQTGMGSGFDRDDFLMMLNGRGQTNPSDVAEVVGSAVVDVVEEWVEAAAEGQSEATRGGQLCALLSDLLDLSDRAQWLLLGEHYMPEAGDWPAADAR